MHCNEAYRGSLNLDLVMAQQNDDETQLDHLTAETTDWQ